jgi:hypothetical protein
MPPHRLPLRGLCRVLQSGKKYLAIQIGVAARH